MTEQSYIRYKCDACGRLHESRLGANTCCPRTSSKVFACPICESPHDTLKAAKACEEKCLFPDLFSAKTCSECKRYHPTIEEAVECCRWKTMSHADRQKLASDLERSLNP